ncbi:hypothetical protein TraAM80_01180 [Trypanosoma rangeli]|uniref:Uncharacterized protein n=1 Tax=Trypanosoma rangeli TaxID=5698 RepID=A0A3R7KPJ6_TRYRA|nr:uncharacterized protein TraAM80_01180 [Trypanosoma rangeli]RNF11053.1 hypothetical protein TraAM80_01180 [Trypanosoma rangeli]|eukprot:RNF11053.1 hypothetical protein TraAM80_01180 [Trypanosoma rangeli]
MYTSTGSAALISRHAVGRSSLNSPQMQQSYQLCFTWHTPPPAKIFGTSLHSIQKVQSSSVTLLPSGKHTALTLKYSSHRLSFFTSVPRPLLAGTPSVAYLHQAEIKFLKAPGTPDRVAAMQPQPHLRVAILQIRHCLVNGVIHKLFVGCIVAGGAEHRDKVLLIVEDHAPKQGIATVQRFPQEKIKVGGGETSEVLQKLKGIPADNL